MSANKRICPRCGHENVPRALFCFQCGQNLDQPPNNSGRSDSSFEDHTRYPGGQPLTCLRCGTPNSPNAEQCVGCSAPLTVADMDFNLLAQSSARTSVGQVRTNNEDNVSLWALDGVLLGLVADGLGGAAAGEIASRLAVEAVQADFLGDSRGGNQLQTFSENDLSQHLVDAILEANQAVFDRAQDDPNLKGMGTTSTLAVIRGNRAIIAHVGDSRAYLIDGTEGWINQVTNDHSFTQALVASGHITPEQAAIHPMGHVLYRALGQSLDLEVDVYARYLKAGDRIVMCTDGLTRHLQPTDIARIALDAETPDEATQKLLDLANSRGGEDNVSAVVIFMVEPK